MNRVTPLLLLLSRQTVYQTSRAAIRHAAAISVAARHQAYHGGCVNPPVYGSVNRQHSLVKSVRWLSSAPVEDDMNVFYPGLVNRIESGDIQLIDVREPEELQQWGQITNSFNVPLGQVEEAFGLSDDKFEARFGRPKPSTSDSNIVFHCRSGKRSLTALEAARAQGYSLARHFPGGWLEWAKENNLAAE
ncbi:rhodanese domain-containing protein CG4456-like isoform X2 [Amphiura filiformis]|uniref:rhodanese domain-containing protein CG4456-like isoform X2 n=1 Tax=Amphiura filiformis TaxID=82378 RepID=UPI003B21E603